jgi:hypothetical protein
MTETETAVEVATTIEVAIAPMIQEDVTETTGTKSSTREITNKEILVDTTNTEVFMKTHPLTLCSQQVHS